MATRSRKKDASTSESDTSFNPAEFDPAMKEQADVVQPLADQTAIPPETSFADRHTPSREPDQSHADAVGKKQYTPAPDPFGIATDVIAGVRLIESKQHRHMAILFEEKPSEAVRTKLKENGFSWKPEFVAWVHPMRTDSAMQTRINADKVFQEVSKMIREERGIEHSVGIGA